MKIRNVACITPINTPNYGTVLQAFALQEAVRSLGYQYSVLNYYSKEQELKFSFFGSTQYMNWKYRIAKKVLYPIRKYQLNQILSFQNSHVHLSKRHLTRSELDQCKDEYDAFITGSDQVWNNQEINHFDDAFFLGFAGEKRKIAYAASFGKTYPMLTQEDIAFYQTNIPNIDFISVREKTGSDIVKRTTDRESQWVCDPVYLLTKEQWEQMSESPSEDHYVLAYLVGDGINFDVNKQIVAKARDLGKRKGLKVKVVGIGLSSVLYGAFSTPTIPEWLGLIKNADMLLTNAFHGTAFATLFRTPFYSFVNGDANNRMNTRIYDILSYLGLEDRIVDFRSTVNSDEISNRSWDYAANRIEMFRKESLNFLKESLDH